MDEQTDCKQTGKGIARRLCEENMELFNIKEVPYGDPKACQGWSGGGTNNKTSDPQFAYNQLPYGYYHIRYESDCREGGDGYSYDYPDEQDMDDQDRGYDTKVDIGADEYSCEETFNSNDYYSLRE